MVELRAAQGSFCLIVIVTLYYTLIQNDSSSLHFHSVNMSKFSFDIQPLRLRAEQSHFPSCFMGFLGNGKK